MSKSLLFVKGDLSTLNEVKDWVESQKLACDVEIKDIESEDNLPSSSTIKGLFISASHSLETIEKEMISYQLFAKNFNMSLVAKTLGLSRATLYRKLKDYDMNIQQLREKARSNEAISEFKKVS